MLVDIEYTYNNSYYKFIGIALFKVVYSKVITYTLELVKLDLARLLKRAL